MKSPDVAAPPDKTSAVSWGGWSYRTRSRALGLEAESHRMSSRFMGWCMPYGISKRRKMPQSSSKRPESTQEANRRSPAALQGCPQRRRGGGCARAIVRRDCKGFRVVFGWFGHALRTHMARHGGVGPALVLIQQTDGANTRRTLERTRERCQMPWEASKNTQKTRWHDPPKTRKSTQGRPLDTLQNQCLLVNNDLKPSYISYRAHAHGTPYLIVRMRTLRYGVRNTRRTGYVRVPRLTP